MNLLKGLFRSRDKPQNHIGSTYSFFFGGTASGKTVNERTAMQTTAVYACVRILAETIASLPLNVYRSTDNGKEKAINHQLYYLLHDEPNPEMTSFVFRETLMSHLLLWGNAYAQIIRDGRGKVLALYPLLPDRMTVDRSPKGLIDGIKGRIERVREIAGEVAETVKNRIKEALSIRSPSQVMREYGLNISEGLSTGMQEGLSFVEGSVSDIIATLVDMKSSLEKITNETNAKLLEAEKEYADQCREVKSKLIQDEIALQQELSDKLAAITAAGLEKEAQAIEAFEQSYAAKVESIKNQIGLFEEVKPQKVSGKSLLGNLEDQVQEFDSWQANLKSLAAKGVDEGLIDELRQMGVKAAPQVAALNTLTTDELNKYVSLWKTKNAQARAEANIEMRQARVELGQRLSEIRLETQNQLTQQTIEMQNKLMEMKAKADEELAKYKKAWEEKNGEIKKNAAETIATIEKKYEEIVQKSAGYGIQAMSELIRGIRSRMSALQSVMDEVRSIMGSGMDPNQRNSPSLVDKIKIGVVDITAAYSSLKNNLSGLDFKSALVGVAPLALGAVAANTTSNSSTTINQISITVNGTADAGEQIYRTLLAKGVRFSG